MSAITFSFVRIISRDKMFFSCNSVKDDLCIFNNNNIVVFPDYRQIRDATLKIQHAYRGWKQRLVFLKKRRAVVVIQSHLRGVFAREVLLVLDLG